jgi:hypothetical protein
LPEFVGPTKYSNERALAGEPFDVEAQAEIGLDPLVDAAVLEFLVLAHEPRRASSSALKNEGLSKTWRR